MEKDKGKENKVKGETGRDKGAALQSDWEAICLSHDHKNPGKEVTNRLLGTHPTDTIEGEVRVLCARIVMEQ